MVPLARALEARGHRVAFATDPGFCAYVRGVGFEAHPAGLNQREADERLDAIMPESEWEAIAPEDGMRYLLSRLFGPIRVPPMLEDLRSIFAEWLPELVIHDTAEMAGAIAAEAAGIPHVEHSFGILRPEVERRLSTEAVATICSGLGVRNPGVGGIGGELYLDICPPGIQEPEIADVPHVQRIRPMGFDAAPDDVLPGWVADLPPRPTVYVTMGTFFNNAASVFTTVLDGLRAEPVNVIVTVGKNVDPAVLGPQPDNVHVERYIPQSQLLPYCHLLVSHAGSGALLGALNAGVPMLAIPQGADQFSNAARIVDVGLGLRLMESDLNPIAVRDSARRLLGDGEFARVARSQKQAIEDMPSPESVVPVLEALVN
jgi:UDP-N-acetylglucosamine transferase subunit ALG13